MPDSVNKTMGALSLYLRWGQSCFEAELSSLYAFGDWHSLKVKLIYHLLILRSRYPICMCSEKIKTRECLYNKGLVVARKYFEKYKNHFDGNGNVVFVTA